MLNRIIVFLLISCVISAMFLRTVDLRSDTVTKPSINMRKAMSEAVVGDDVFGEDPTIIELESKVASMFQKESSLFVPTGTMSNLAAIMSWCQSRGSEMILGHNSHIHIYEQGGAAQLAGVSSQILQNNIDGSIDIESIKEAIRIPNIHFPKTELIAVENTHNMCGGRIVPIDYMKELYKVASDRGIPVHVDGARIWNAAAGSGVPLHEWGSCADSLSVCLSKGLGAPVGSLLVGPRSFIDRARRTRKALGGGMRQAGVLAAAGLRALSDYEGGILQIDHDRAKRLGMGIAEIPGFHVNTDYLETNIFLVDLDESAPVEWDAQRLNAALKELGVKTLLKGPRTLRLVVHRDLDDADITYALQCFYAISSVMASGGAGSSTSTATTASSSRGTVSMYDEATPAAPVTATATAEVTSVLAPTLVSDPSYDTVFEPCEIFGVSSTPVGFCVFLRGLAAYADRVVRVAVTPVDPMAEGLDKDQAESQEAVTILQLFQGIDVESYLPQDALKKYLMTKMNSATASTASQNSGTNTESSLQSQIGKFVEAKLSTIRIHNVTGDNGRVFKGEIIGKVISALTCEPSVTIVTAGLTDTPSSSVIPTSSASSTTTTSDSTVESFHEETPHLEVNDVITESNDVETCTTNESSVQECFKETVCETSVKNSFDAVALAIRHHSSIEANMKLFSDETVSFSLEELRMCFPNLIIHPSTQPVSSTVTLPAAVINTSTINIEPVFAHEDGISEDLSPLLNQSADTIDNTNATAPQVQYYQ